MKISLVLVLILILGYPLKAPKYGGNQDSLIQSGKEYHRNCQPYGTG
ncbi:hypothetical protein [Arenibacter sp. F20364]|nr:hypothetical protein [Arenibacter sp. F20364]MCK0189139.1 hypothetical protein [Arenibacter sp. F20364]